MTREEHLVFCKKCTNRTFDSNKGIVCKLTGDIAKFENNCADFNRDEEVPDEPVSVVEQHKIANAELTSELRSKVEEYQSLPFAIIGGFSISILCALLWAAITVSTQYQIGYMALGLGLAVGMGVRYFGQGVDQIYGIVGAILALVGCLLGNLFSQVGFIAHEQGAGYIQTLSYLDLEIIGLLMEETFSPMDLLFYGIAVYEGYRFAFRPITEENIRTENYEPTMQNLRLPLVIVSAAVLVVTSISLSLGYSGDQQYYYESGALMSTGKLESGVEQGAWEYYYEDGTVSLRAEFLDGRENGTWTWYGESGNVTIVGNYQNGLSHGSWVSYYENGGVKDSANHVDGRLNGPAVGYHENGQLRERGAYKRDRTSGKWETYNEDGIKIAEGSFDDADMVGLWKFWNNDGTPLREFDYSKDGNFKIINAWDNEGIQTVVEGNGTYLGYDDDGYLAQKGEVVDGKKIGDWKIFYTDGTLQEEGTYEGNDYLIRNTWSATKAPEVVNGNGAYFSYYASNKIMESGDIMDGRRDGVWNTYYDQSSAVLSTVHYQNGKVNGKTTQFYESGNPLAEGEHVDGKQEGEWTWYFDTGGIQCTATYVNDKKEGVQTFYSETGIESKEEVYENGQLVSERLL